METKRTIALVLRSGKDFNYKDVELIVHHILDKWSAIEKPRILCFYDKISQPYDLGHITLLPLPNNLPGTWSRMYLYSPEVEQYRPFLYIDLDTAVIQSLEKIFDVVTDPTQYITMEDLWFRNRLATGLVWFPKGSQKISDIWRRFRKPTGARMDTYIQSIIKRPDAYWQHITTGICDFKPYKLPLLNDVPKHAIIVCFHGNPRIFHARTIPWVKEYTKEFYPIEFNLERKVTVIIPYNIDRGFLQQAIASVPKGVQLLVSQGNGNWPENFNKVWSQVTGDYVRWLHEDDMLTEGSIEASVRAIEEQNVDFVHGNAVELTVRTGAIRAYLPSVVVPTYKDLLRKNIIHSATLMYKRTVFERVGMLDETLNTAEEYEFNLRCLKAGLRIGYCNNTLAVYRRHDKQKVRMVSRRDKNNERNAVRRKYIYTI